MIEFNFSRVRVVHKLFVEHMNNCILPRFPFVMMISLSFDPLLCELTRMDETINYD